MDNEFGHSAGFLGGLKSPPTLFHTPLGSVRTLSLWLRLLVQGCELKALRFILTFVIAVAAGCQAPAMTAFEWDLKFLEALSRRGYTDLADEVGQQMLGAAKDPAEKGKIALRRAAALLDAAENAAGEEQLGLVKKAEDALKQAVAANPEIAKSIEYAEQATILKQRQATILATSLSKLPESEKEKVFKQADALFTQVEKDFGQVATLLNKRIDDLQSTIVGNNQNPRATQKSETELDDAYFHVTVVHFRTAMALYAHLELYDNKPGDMKRKDLLKAVLEKLDQVSFEGEDTSLMAYAFYYLGLVSKKEGDLAKAEESFTKVITTPRGLRVPDLIRRSHFDLVDTLTKAEKFEAALNKCETLIAYLRQTRAGEDEVTKAMLYKATICFSAATKLKTQAGQGPLPEAARKYYESGMAISRTIINTNEKWAGTTQDIINEWAKKIFPDSDDPTVLMAEGRILYHDEKYVDAAPAFRKVLANPKAREKTRVEAGYFLAMCHYHSERYYDAYVAGDWLGTRFDSKKHDYVEKSQLIAILSIKKQLEKSSDVFDKALYIKTRKQLGEEEFLIIEARDLIDQGQLEKAIDVYRRITPKAASVYDSALYEIAQCIDMIADRELKARRIPQCVARRAEAAKLYSEFITWSQANRPPADRIRQRQELECRAIHKIGRLMLDGTADSFYRGEIRRSGSNIKDLADTVRTAAAAMLQPLPEKLPANAQEALALLDKFAVGRVRKFIDLSTGIKTKYPDAVEIHPYVLHLRVMAFVRLEDPQAAEKDLAALAEFKDFTALADITCRVAMAFDGQARKQEEAQQAADAEESYGRTVGLFQEVIKLDPKFSFLPARQRFDVVYYVVMLFSKRGQGISVDDKLALVKSFLEEFAGEPKRENEIDNVLLVQAEYLIVRNKLGDAIDIYEKLMKRYDAEFAEMREKDPKAGRPARHWQAKQGLAAARKVGRKYADALKDFMEIRQNVPAGGDTWWQAAYNAADCMVELKRYEMVLKMLKTTFLLHPDMGGLDLRNKFVMLLGRIASGNLPKDQAGCAKQARELIDQINQHAEKK